MRVKLKRTVAAFLSVLVAVSMLISGQAPMLVKAESVITVAFTDADDVDAESGTVTYDVGGTSVTVAVTGAAISANSVEVSRDNLGSVTFTLNNNFDPETMEVKVYVDGGFCDTLTVDNSVTTLEKKTTSGGYPDSIKLAVTEKSNGGGEPEQEPVSGAVGDFSETDGYTTTATATLNTAGNAEFYINGVSGQEREFNETTFEETVTQKTSITYPYNASEKVQFEFVCLINERYTSITINGTNYTKNIPGYDDSGNKLTSDESIAAEVLGAIDLNGNSQTVSIVIPDVPKAEAYTIVVKREAINLENDAAFWPVGNFLWSYLDRDRDSDDYLDHGRLTFVSLSYSGTTYASLENLAAAGKCYLQFKDPQEGQVGEAVLPAGAQLTVKLIPEYGYQLTSFTINGGGFTPGEEIGVYTFTIPNGNFHLGAHFTQVADVVKPSTNEIAGGNISLGANELDMGSAVLSVTDATTDETEQSAFAEAAGEYAVDSYLDLSLNQVIYKGKADAFWENEKSTLDSAATISLSLSEALDGNAVQIIHQTHAGGYEVIPATYNTATKTVTFNTSSFSKYAICYTTKASTGGSTTPSGGADTGDTTTETKPDGTTVETSTETKSDGTKVETTVETKTDGTKTETVVETAKDGSVKTTETVTQADGSETKTEKETETNAAGKEVEVTTVTQKDTQGNVTGITETSVIDNIVDKANATITVEKNADGKVTSAQAEVDKNGSKTKSGVKGTLNGSVVSQIIEAAGTKSVEISMTVTAGKKEYTVKADAEDITAGNKLKVMAIDPKTGNYILVNAKTYTVSKAGSVSVTLPEDATYQLLDSKEAAAVEKEILATVKVKKTSTTVEKGKKTSVQMSSKLDMDNVESITYSTSKKSVATVSKSGKVTAKQAGTVTITATVTLKNGKTKTVKMKVKVK